MTSHTQTQGAGAGSCFGAGETVWMLVDGARVNCRVLRTDATSSVLVPEEMTPELKRMLKRPPAHVTVQTADGAQRSLTVGSTVSLVALTLAPAQPSSKGTGRRRQVRINVHLRVSVSADGERWWETLGGNISEDGVLIQQPVGLSLAVGDRVMVRIQLPQAGLVSADAIAKRIRKPAILARDSAARIALEFTRISMKDEDKVFGFVLWHQAKNPNAVVDRRHAAR